MRDVVSDKTFHTVVGIESGGSPLAAHLAAQLPTGLRLIRKNQTELKSILAGPSDEIVGNVLVVDDVLGKGDSLARTLDVIKNMANGVTFLSVFSYGAESQLSTKLGVSVKSLYGVQELVDCETDHNCRSIARLALDEYRKKLGIVS
jgi:orotate phosphoribosyltransferase